MGTGVSLAQPQIDEMQRLNFGTLAIASNASVSRFTYPRTGNNISIQGQFVLIERGTPGTYRFTGFPANTVLSISINSTSLSEGGTGIPELLTVDNYDYTDITTDSQGEAELVLGARLNTSGNSGNYVDALYSGNTVIRADYWQPDVNAFVTNTENVTIESDIRSTLSIDQEQAVSYGTLFARSSSTNQAVLTLSPTGAYSISEPGDTRLVSLARPQQGIFRVSGAAPNYSLQITAQTTDVLLQHALFPGAAPHFIMSNFVTSPDGSGTTDVNGELLISIGATLKTEQTASPEVYPSGDYTGTYQLTVSY